MACLCRRQHLMWRQGGVVAAFLILLLGHLSLGSARYDISSDEEVRWDFHDSLEGWAASTAMDMDMEVYPRGGELRGAIRGSAPHFDSPPLDLDCDDKHHIVFRAAYDGAATMGRITVRSGGQLPGLHALDDFQANWVPRRNITLMAASSNSTAMSRATDSSKYTYWTSSGSTDQWLTIDTGAFLPVTRIEIDVTRDKYCPRNMRLQKSLIATGGEFHNVATFAITNDSRLNSTDYTHVFEGFYDWSRFWRLYIDDNFGASNIRIREIRFLGPDEGFLHIPFDVVNDGLPHTYYVPLHDYFQGTLSQLRFHPAIKTEAVTGITAGSVAPKFGESFSLDWLAIVKAPTIHRVQGCINKYYPDSNMGFGYSNLTAHRSVINDYLPHYSTSFNDVDVMPYTTTYNCYRGGGQVIRISGLNLGESPTNITVGGQPCTQVTVEARQSSFTCLLPPGMGQGVEVAMANARYPGLWHAVPYLSYQVAPPAPLQPVISNLAACSMDLAWQLRGDYWDALTITGYNIRVREGVAGSGGTQANRTWDVYVGNVTFTTVVGLLPDTQYDFAVAAMAENQTAMEWQNLDLYGRRPMVPGGLVSPFSTPTNVTATLPADITFQVFDANSTLNHGPDEEASSLGPTGVRGGEGHYGLVLMGDANLQGCNSSFACCDGYNETIGPSSCSGSYLCTAIGTVDYTYEDGESHRDIDTNKPGGFKTIRRYAGEGSSSSRSSYSPVVPRLPCGPALRLTSSQARLTGSAWYSRQVEVREGFETTFRFQITSPSLRCNNMDDVYTHCRSRGADGFAFVLQLESDMALGKGGMGLGYQEIDNSLALEFDTYHNFELIEPYENHVSVNTRGWRHPNSANHSYSLASDVRVPNLADGRVHVVKVRYEPSFDESHLLRGLFQASPYTGEFFVNANFFQGGQGDWGVGTGLLTIWLDDLFKPLFVTPLNLDYTLRLNRGRAWAGFTAATGDDRWQVHDILDWSFTSLRKDVPYYPPLVVNGVGTYI